MFPQNHCKRRFGATLDVLEIVDVVSDFGLAFGVFGPAELALPLEFEDMVVGCFSHPAEKFQQLFLCSPCCNIVSARLFGDT